jgi:hypothetical protein
MGSIHAMNGVTRYSQYAASFIADRTVRLLQLMRPLEKGMLERVRKF